MPKATKAAAERTVTVSATQIDKIRKDLLEIGEGLIAIGERAIASRGTLPEKPK